MKVRFTHKEFTLLAGIAVAIIIMLTLWLQPATAGPSEVSRKQFTPLVKPAAKVVFEVALFIIQNPLK